MVNTEKNIWIINYILIDAVNNNSNINIKDTVQFVRNQRVNMVQTWVGLINKTIYVEII